MSLAESHNKPKSIIWDWIGRLIVTGICLVFAGFFLTPFNRYPPEMIKGLREDTALEVLTLDPKNWPSDLKHTFHHYDIVDQKKVTSAADRKELAAALQASTWFASSTAGCFNPRHAFEIHTAEGVWDVLVCYECRKARFYRPDGTDGGLHIRMNGERMNELFLKLGLKLKP